MGDTVPPSLSVTKLHVPLPVMVTILIVVLGGVTSMTLVWSKTTGHASDKQVHIDAGEVVKGGGVAFKNDVVTARNEFQERMAGEYQKTRRMLKEMTIKCSGARGGLSCTVDLPEP